MWCSISRTFCNELDESLLTNEKDKIFTNNNRQKILGVFLFPLTDMFAAHINKHNTDIKKWTQRKLIGHISRLFYPLRIRAPVTIVMKIKLQEIWQHWDEELPEDLQQFVKDGTTNKAHLNEIKIPRSYNLPTAQPKELHIFCDASTQALATVIFIRFADKTVYRTKFVMGKTRVAPLKPQTIPRPELQAAVYACRLQRAFTNNSTLSISKITHWTDSTFLLHWICNINNKQKTCIANRLHEIRHATAIDDWKYVTYKTQSSQRRNPRNQDNRTQTLAMLWIDQLFSSCLQFMTSNFRRNHTYHRRECADNRYRRHTNLQPNLQYTAYLRRLQVILIAEKTSSNHLLYFEDIG